MKTVGLTGGIGMGKSTCAQILSGQGIAVIDTDDLARQIVEPGQPALAEVRSAFGPTVIGDDGRLRRDILAGLVFGNDVARRQLEAILHPRIRDRWKVQLATWRAEGRSLAVVVIPLLFETKAETEFDRVICLACSAATQRERLRARGWSDAQLQQRIAAQMPIEEKLLHSHHVVWTEGGLDVHARQIDLILSPLRTA